jgi:hypothetical protein
MNTSLLMAHQYTEFRIQHQANSLLENTVDAIRQTKIDVKPANLGKTFITRSNVKSIHNLAHFVIFWLIE